MRKARSDSKLKTLPPERQEAIVAWLQSGSLAETVKKIRTGFGLRTSQAALSEFLSWYMMRHRLTQTVKLADQVKEFLRDCPDLDLADEQISKAGQLIFERQAIEGEDGKLYAMLRQLRQKDAVIGLEQARFQRETCKLFIQWATNEQAKTIATAQMSNRDKIAKLGQLMFGEDWE